MITTPTVGRKVWFRPRFNSQMATIEGQPLDATVIAVWGDHCVNLSIVDVQGMHHFRSSAYLRQDGVALPAEAMEYAEWMPYQVNQHAKNKEVQVVANVSTPEAPRV